MARSDGNIVKDELQARGVDPTSMNVKMVLMLHRLNRNDWGKTREELNDIVEELRTDDPGAIPVPPEMPADEV